MPRHYFENRGNVPAAVPPGDYILKLIAFEARLSQAGNDTYELKFEVQPSGVHVYDHWTFTAKAGWWIDVCMKALGIAPTVDEIEMEIDDAYMQGLVGVRGWATLAIDEYQGKKRNKLVAWITDKPIPAREATPTPASEGLPGEEMVEESIPF